MRFQKRQLCYIYRMIYVIALVFVMSYTTHVAAQITAVKYELDGTPPNLTGTLEKNFILSDAEQYKLDELKGPESFVYYKGHIYTGLADGRIVDISDCGVQTVARLSPKACAGESQCGRPMGMRIDNFGRLIVADSTRGIFRINLQTGSIETLYSSNTPVNGRKCKFINDVALARDGTILFSDSSAKWSRKDSLYVLLEGEATGRLLAYSDKSNKTIAVLDKLAFPNGLEFSPDDDYLLIAETSRARIRRLNLKTGTSWLQLTNFASNLPGLPDNIRASGRGTYWVAMSQARHSNMSSMVDEYASQPQMRQMVAAMFSPDQVIANNKKYGMVIELDNTGNILRSLQDPTGAKISAVSEAMERDGFLYLGSHDKSYVSRVPLSDKFDVDRFVAKIKSTCRATKMNITKVRSVLKRLVAIAELRKFLINTKTRMELERMRGQTTIPITTSNITSWNQSSITTDVPLTSTVSMNVTRPLNLTDLLSNLNNTANWLNVTTTVAPAGNATTGNSSVTVGTGFNVTSTAPVDDNSITPAMTTLLSNDTTTVAGQLVDSNTTVESTTVGNALDSTADESKVP